MDRLSEKNDLLLKLGRLFGPMQSLVEHPERYNDQERAETIARYLAEHSALYQQFRQFSVGQPGHRYAIEQHKFYMALQGVETRLREGRDLDTTVKEALPKAAAAIHAVPVRLESTIYEAGSPFTAYSKMRSLCEADASKSITWFDPYFGPDIFFRYLQFIKPEVHVTLVASEPGVRAGRKNLERWNNFLDISKIFALERGVSKYALRIATTIHDRWLVLDEKRIYNLGGSVKDAAVKDIFTIATVDPNGQNLAKISSTIGASTEWFGNQVTTHRMPASVS